MDQEVDFIEQILQEAEAKEAQQRMAYYDLLLIETGKLQSQIEKNFHQAELEAEIIKNWAIQTNSKIRDKLEFLEKKLEAFMREENVKTLDLPNGILKLHKKPDRVEISDMNEFLALATPEMLNVIPESVKPDLNKIKTFIKQSRKIPAGVTFIEGLESFTYKLKSKEIK